MSKFENHLSKYYEKREQIAGEIYFSWERFSNKNREYLKNFHKFKENLIKKMILKFCNITKNLDYALDELLHEVIVLIIRNMFSISSEEIKQCMLEGLSMAKERCGIEDFYYKTFLFMKS